MTEGKMSKRICPKEDLGFNYLTGQMYHKIRSGCGWAGKTSECELDMDSWLTHKIYACPECGKETEDFDTHEKKMDGKPSGWVSKIPVGFIPFNQGLKFCPHCGEGL